MNAPVLFIPDNYYSSDNSPVLVVDLGIIKAKSDIVPYDPMVDYKMISIAKFLYDTYNLEVSDL